MKNYLYSRKKEENVKLLLNYWVGDKKKLNFFYIDIHLFIYLNFIHFFKKFGSHFALHVESLFCYIFDWHDTEKVFVRKKYKNQKN